MSSLCFFCECITCHPRLLLACLTSTMLSSVDNATYPLWLCVVVGALAEWGLCCTNQQFYFPVFHWSVSTIVEWPWNGLYRNSVNTPLGVCEIRLFVGPLGARYTIAPTYRPGGNVSLVWIPGQRYISFGMTRWSLYQLNYFNSFVWCTHNAFFVNV